MQQKPVTGRPMPRSPKVFLSYAEPDKEAARTLHRRLADRGIDVWFDQESLTGGVEWESEIRQQLRSSDAVLVCLSKTAVARRGVAQREITLALEASSELPEGANYLIPLRLDDCDVPFRLKRYHCIDLYLPDGYDRVFRALAPQQLRGQHTPGRSYLVASRRPATRMPATPVVAAIAAACVVAAALWFWWPRPFAGSIKPSDSQSAGRPSTAPESAPPSVLPPQEKRKQPAEPQRTSGTRSHDTESQSPPAPVPGRFNVALLINAPQGPNGLAIDNAFYGLVHLKNAKMITNLVRERGLDATTFFTRIYGGDGELSRKTMAQSQADYLISGTIRYSIRRADQVDRDLLSCDVSLAYKVADRRGDIVDTGTLSAVGPGFNASNALERALEILAQQFQSRISGSLAP